MFKTALTIIAAALFCGVYFGVLIAEFVSTISIVF